MSDDPTVTDPNWSAVARFLEGRIARGQRVNAPTPFTRVTGLPSPPDPAFVPDWAVVHKGQIDEYPAAALRRIATETTPVFANDVFVVFARRPTFGLRNQRTSVHVNALYERIGDLAGDGALAKGAAPPAAPAAIRAPMPPAVAPAVPVAPVSRTAPTSPSLPPEALALLRAPPAAAGMTVWTGLRTRIVALLAERPVARVAEIGIEGLAAALGASGPLEGGTDAAILRVQDPASLDDGLRRVGGLLGPEGRLVVVTENAASLGRRLARASGRGTSGGLSVPELRSALRAAGFRPTRLDGFSLDPWRAVAEAPPHDQSPGTSGGDILDVAGADAGPDHAALLLVLAVPT